jgi:tetratricopeptide (TPR) repeat protein
MNQSLQRALLVIGIVALAGAGFFGWRSYSARRAWREMQPALPNPVGAAAPGLDARLAACHARLQTWPPDHAALAEFTRLCHANGFLDEAMNGYRALMALEPATPRWPHFLAAILAGYGRLDEAMPLLRRTTVLAPEHVVAWLRLGDVCLKSNATADAEAAYQEALKRAPKNPYALLGLARCELQTGRLTAARQRLQETLADTPDFYDALGLLPMVFEQLGNPAAAEAARARMPTNGHHTDPADAWSDELMADCYNPYTLLTAASAANADGLPAKARTLLTRALALAPDDARLHRQMAKTLVNLGDIPGARRELERAVALAPADETMQLDLITLLRSVQDHAGLARAVAAAVRACPDSAALHFEAGVLAAQAGELDEAGRHFEFTWKNQPDQPAAACELAKVHFRTNRPEAGVAVLEELLKIHPTDEVALQLLVRHGIERGDARTAGWLHRAAAAPGITAAALAEMRQAYQRRFGVN